MVVHVSTVIGICLSAEAELSTGRICDARFPHIEEKIVPRLADARELGARLAVPIPQVQAL